MKTTKTPQQLALGRAKAQVMMLFVQLLLGMAENLIGRPSESHGLSRAASASILGLHIFVGIALVISGVLAIKFTKGQANMRRAAWIGEQGVLTAFIAGVLNMADRTYGPWWSYLMTLAFLEAYLAYGALYIRLIKNSSTANANKETLHKLPNI